MSQCETCGNEYERTFTVTMQGSSHTFDSFECAIAALAPTCQRCGVRVLGHGVEANGTIYCCANCAEQAGVSGLSDHA